MKTLAYSRSTSIQLTSCAFAIYSCITASISFFGRWSCFLIRRKFTLKLSLQQLSPPIENHSIPALVNQCFKLPCPIMSSLVLFFSPSLKSSLFSNVLPSVLDAPVLFPSRSFCFHLCMDPPINSPCPISQRFSVKIFCTSKIFFEAEAILLL